MKILRKHFINKGRFASSGKSSASFDPKELAKGIAVELEHTDLEALAKKIALDHLAEIPDYYTSLAKQRPKPGEN